MQHCAYFFFSFFQSNFTKVQKLIMDRLMVYVHLYKCGNFGCEREEVQVLSIYPKWANPRHVGLDVFGIW